MNRIDTLFKDKKRNILSVYFTAGYPLLDSTTEIIKSLATSGADMVEIGMPFSDPMADGPVIQHSNEVALQNGMSLLLLFKQLHDIRNETDIPLLLMGYLNPVIQFGVENFCRHCSEAGIDGVILPDLPPEVFLNEFIEFFEKYNIYNVLLISPQSDEQRINAIDKISRGFIYLVSSSSVTGTKGSFSDNQISYFNRVKKMELKNPSLIGFGISNAAGFKSASEFSAGGIIGSAFVRMLGDKGNSNINIKEFIRSIRGQ